MFLVLFFYLTPTLRYIEQTDIYINQSYLPPTDTALLAMSANFGEGIAFSN
jgi:hypothetical protein